MLWVLITLTVIGFIAYGVITIVCPKTAKDLKNEISSLAPARKSRFAQFQYYDPKTGKQINATYISIPGKVPKIRYLVENSSRNSRLYSGEEPLHRP